MYVKLISRSSVRRRSEQEDRACPCLKNLERIKEMHVQGGAKITTQNRVPRKKI